jgi:hypothetical protein
MMDYRVPGRIGWFGCISCGAVTEALSRGYPDINGGPCDCGSVRFGGGSVLSGSPEEATRMAGLHRECWRRMDLARAEFWSEHGHGSEETREAYVRQQRARFGEDFGRGGGK